MRHPGAQSFLTPPSFLPRSALHRQTSTYFQHSHLNRIWHLCSVPSSVFSIGAKDNTGTYLDGMLGANAAAISHRPENSTAALSSGGSGAFLFSSQLSPALSVESSGSGTSTIKGIPEGKKHNRWSGSVSSLSRSNSDSSTLSKNRPAQHSYSASVPHIVGIRTERPNQASRTKISPHSIESKNGKVSSDKISTATQHNQSSQSQSARPPASLSKVQPKLPIAPRKNRQHRSLSQRAMLASALNKANAAVLLDSAGNIEGAIEAYGDACALLQQAVSRAEVEGDKAQLQSIVCIPNQTR